MNLRSMIRKELRERPTPLATSLLAVLLGVAAFVGLRSVNVASEQAVSKELETLGANVLILPRDVSLQNFYAADAHGKTLPEEYAMRLSLANLTGIEHVAPKLSLRTEVAGTPVTLTGILPQADFKAQAAWGNVGMFAAAPNVHEGCKKSAVAVPKDGVAALSLLRIVEELAEGDIYLGADLAPLAKEAKHGVLNLYGEVFRIAGVLPATGTVDDGRIFAHLHAVQRIAKTGEVVNAIEVMGCCKDVAGALPPQLEKMFPDAKIVTISQVVQTQVGVNRLLGRLSLAVFFVLIALGAAGMAGAMYANVVERRREIGTLLALGAPPAWIARLFLGKAALLGAVGGTVGAVLGSVAAVVWGPQFAEIAVDPLPGTACLAAVAAVVVCLAASSLPAWNAARLDPCLCFKET